MAAIICRWSNRPDAAKRGAGAPRKRLRVWGQKRTGKELGLCKNCVDACCVLGSLVLGAVFGNVLLGVGLGTILSMIGVGRVIYLFNLAARVPLRRKAGLED